MTLDEFKATGRYVPDLSAAVSEFYACEPGVGGRVYLDSLTIEDVDTFREPTRSRCRPFGRWYLLLGTSEQVTDDLAALEADLFHFAGGEGFVPPAADPHADRAPDFLALGFSVWQTGGTCKAWGRVNADGSHFLVTDTGGAFLPDGRGPASVGYFRDEHDERPAGHDFATLDFALAFLRAEIARIEPTN